MAENWKKVESNFKQWSEEGEEVEGKLVEIRDGQYGKVFDIELADGEKITVGGAVLANKITPSFVGKMIKVVYKGEEKGKQGKYKVFDVYVAE